MFCCIHSVPLRGVGQDRRALAVRGQGVDGVRGGRGRRERPAIDPVLTQGEALDPVPRTNSLSTIVFEVPSVIIASVTIPPRLGAELDGPGRRKPRR